MCFKIWAEMDIQELPKTNETRFNAQYDGGVHSFSFKVCFIESV